MTDSSFVERDHARGLLTKALADVTERDEKIARLEACTREVAAILQAMCSGQHPGTCPACTARRKTEEVLR